MPINIHGKDYITVAERLKQAHDDGKLVSITTEILEHKPVVIKATITMTDGKVYTGISSVPQQTYKQIEKMNPYEVAETSAVGRALGFAGFGAVESIASAEEVVKSQMSEENASKDSSSASESTSKMCFEHDVPMEQQWSEKKQKNYWVHRSEIGDLCFGRGYIQPNS